MSNGNTAAQVSPVINDLIATINAGQAAIARVPELESTIRDLTAKLDAAQAHNQGLETNAIHYREQISNLNDKVRSLVVERDDASFRELETSDKLDRLEKAVRGMATGLLGTADEIHPPKKPEPAPVVSASPTLQPYSEQGSGSASSAPTGESAPGPTQNVASIGSGSGQSESGPTVNSGDGKTAASPNVSTTPVTPQGSASMPTEAAFGETNPPVDTRPWWAQGDKEPSRS